MLTLINTFHGTETRVRAKAGDHISRRVERRIWRDLCGRTDCVCGGAGGVRGGNYVLVHRTYWPNAADGKPYTVEARA
jgi:hypothetical protein